PLRGLGPLHKFLLSKVLHGSIRKGSDLQDEYDYVRKDDVLANPASLREAGQEAVALLAVVIAVVDAHTRPLRHQSLDARFPTMFLPHPGRGEKVPACPESRICAVTGHGRSAAGGGVHGRRQAAGANAGPFATIRAAGFFVLNSF